MASSFEVSLPLFHASRSFDCRLTFVLFKPPTPPVVVIFSGMLIFEKGWHIYLQCHCLLHRVCLCLLVTTASLSPAAQQLSLLALLDQLTARDLIVTPRPKV